MARSRCGILLGMAALATGCSSSGRVVVQDGYRAVAVEPAIIRPAPARPGAMTLAADSEETPAATGRPTPAAGR